MNFDFSSIECFPKLTPKWFPQVFNCNARLDLYKPGASDLISGIIILLCGKCGINNPPCPCLLPSFTDKLSMYYLL